jgi:hypothetical protein
VRDDDSNRKLNVYAITGVTGKVGGAVATVLENNQQLAPAKKLDRYCRVIVPLIFVTASIAVFCPSPRLIAGKGF